jgi:ATP-dependent DNA ligase
MLATLTDAPFDDPGWVFEDKYDGFRMIAEIRRECAVPGGRINKRNEAKIAPRGTLGLRSQ